MLPDGRQALEVPFQPTPTVNDFIYDRRMVTGIFGPLGTAKTTGLCMKAWLYAQAFPGARIVIVRDTYPNLIETTQRTFFSWFPPGPCGTYHKTEKRFTLWTTGQPSEVLFRALDDERDIRNVLSLEVAAAGVDEPQGGPNTKGGGDPGIDESLYRALLARVGRQKGYPAKMLWMAGNPPAPSHWIAKEFGYPGFGEPRRDDPRKQLYLVDRDENRHNLHPTYYEDLIANWGTGTAMTRRFIYGEWLDIGTMKPFRAEWITYWGEPGERPPDGLVIEAGFDPAISKRDTAARSALVVAGQVRRGQDRGVICILEAIAGHWSVYEQVDKILKAQRRHGFKVIRIEDVAYQRALKDVLEREQRIAGLQFRVEPVAPDGDKVRRANAWSAWVEDGTIRFGPGQEDLVRCLLAVPEDDTAWDLVDAAGICVRGFQLLQPESERLPWVAPLSSPTRAIGYVANPLKQAPAVAPSIPVGPPTQAPAGSSAAFRLRPPGQANKLARSYAVRIDR